MKRLIVTAAALACASSFAATLNPVQLLNPAGSSAGQFITSTGATTAPTWSSVTLAALGGLSAAAAAATYAPRSSPMFTGTVTMPAGTTFSQPNIVGVTSNSGATTGSVGEYNIVAVTGTAVTNGTAFNASSTLLQAGDYDVQCLVKYLPAGTTTTSGMFASVSLVSATLPGDEAISNLTWAAQVVGNTRVASPQVRVLLAAPTTVYCVGSASFATSTMAADGRIRWRRAH